MGEKRLHYPRHPSRDRGVGCGQEGTRQGATLNSLKLFGLTAAVFFAIDLVWIGVVAQSFYQKHLGHLLRPDVLWVPALVFYTVYIVGILVFAVLPGLEGGSLQRTVALGAFLGLFAYATFDLTCMAMFRDFPGIVVAVDLAWGTVLTASVAAAGFGFGRWLGIG